MCYLGPEQYSYEYGSSEHIPPYCSYSYLYEYSNSHSALLGMTMDKYEILE